MIANIPNSIIFRGSLLEYRILSLLSKRSSCPPIHPLAFQCNSSGLMNGLSQFRLLRQRTSSPWEREKCRHSSPQSLPSFPSLNILSTILNAFNSFFRSKGLKSKEVSYCTAFPNFVIDSYVRGLPQNWNSSIE